MYQKKDLSNCNRTECKANRTQAENCSRYLTKGRNVTIVIDTLKEREDAEDE